MYGGGHDRSRAPQTAIPAMRPAGTSDPLLALRLTAIHPAAPCCLSTLSALSAPGVHLCQEALH